MQILIKSNPYEQKIVYKCRANEESEWEKIEEGKLYSDEFVKGFFPFLVEKVLDAIIEQYSNESHGKTKLIFAGPDDEYQELELAIATERYNEKPYTEYIEIEKSEYYLENARDILPEIKRVYKQRISPLIINELPDRLAVQKDLDKFSEASDDIIPICVIGNYSSGKSTFINALLGREVLPSADKPTTAKYFKISNSKQPDRASLDFGYYNQNVVIRYDNIGYKFVEGKSDNELIGVISKELDRLKDADLIAKVNKTIEVINGFEKKRGIECISDLITLNIPFGKGIWGEASSNFVIIDTPGSNSASNLDHKKVLDTAMEGLTNGLPIFVSTRDALDTNDNLSLYNDIVNMKELDSRFTIIVVNQADVARIPKDGFTADDIDDILSEAVPRNMKSEGIYFVSSIMGLGFKVDGVLMDDGYAETYEDGKSKFITPDSRFYKQLYKYNIMPDRMKAHAMEVIEAQDNLMWANSGLLSIETEIKTFSEKYSHYNKCKQSVRFLSKVIKISEEQLECERIKHAELKDIRETELEVGKKRLINQLQEKSDELRRVYCAEDTLYLNRIIVTKLSELKNVDVQAKEQEFTEKNKSINDIKGKGDNLKRAFASIGDDIATNYTEIIKNGKMENLKKIGPDFFNDVVQTISGVGDWFSTSKKIENDTAVELVKHMNKLYKDDSTEMQELIYEHSVKYWDEKCDDLKKELAKIVHETDVLTDEERDNLTHVIIDYDTLAILQMPDIIFAKSDFDHVIRILDWTITLSDKIKLDKLSRSFNMKLSENVENIKNQMLEHHEYKFKGWMEDLNEEITARIVELNPTLHGKNEEILAEKQKIQKLEELKSNLNFYQRRIEDMMYWKKD